MRCPLSLLVGALLGLMSASAYAQGEFFGRTVGSLTLHDADPPVFTGDLAQFFIEFKGPVIFDNLVLTFQITQDETPPDEMIGGFTFFGVDPANSLSGTITGISFPNEKGIWTGAGSWSASNGTGDFIGLSGEGTYSVALAINAGEAATAFNGTIVPAPAAAAPFGVVLAMGLRRRRSRCALNRNIPAPARGQSRFPPRGGNAPSAGV